MWEGKAESVGWSRAVIDNGVVCCGVGVGAGAGVGAAGAGAGAEGAGRA